ncbi:transposase [Nocardiopsis xinjiangensis]|uniref:transposase n=1 Tax=Nocardiopsis xinjiangensis TaxID=124285 RepID=UPI001F4C564F|nr:transposase [Nocardiopsis xinjiangensis]
MVDPAYTSLTCAECEHVDTRNRVGQGFFLCRGRGVVAHADRNASHDLAARGQSVWNAGREPRAPATPWIRGVWTEEPTRQPTGHYFRARFSEPGRVDDQVPAPTGQALGRAGRAHDGRDRAEARAPANLCLRTPKGFRIDRSAHVPPPQ